MGPGRIRRFITVTSGLDDEITAPVLVSAPPGRHRLPHPDPAWTTTGAGPGFGGVRRTFGPPGLGRAAVGCGEGDRRRSPRSEPMELGPAAAPRPTEGARPPAPEQA